MKERFNKIVEYCEKIENANYDSYTICLAASIEDIEKWEKENQVILPLAYKEWLLLANGFEMGSTVELFPLHKVEKCLFPEYKDYYVVGEYIGDGSMLLIDKIGNFYEFDHAFGLNEKAFEKFLDNWIIEHLIDNLKEIGIYQPTPEEKVAQEAKIQEMLRKLAEIQKNREGSN